ncbi:50S ribosomal protein L21e [Candidatus Woesearchaeota archaeon]|nr:50S ribosomal protein L21e [Candidatus Woesearchaeota archaeon]
MERMGGKRRKTRHISLKYYREKGKVSIRKFFQDFAPGCKVMLLTDSSHPGGAPWRRFYGKCGTVRGKRGGCYEITFFDGGKEKLLITHPLHMKKI